LENLFLGEYLGAKTLAGDKKVRPEEKNFELSIKEQKVSASRRNVAKKYF